MNEHFCILPWVHLHSFPNGNALACCEWDQTQPVGTLPANTLDEIATSSTMNQVRQKMLNNEPVSGCFQCKAKESSGGVSSRTRYNEIFKDDISTYISNTNTDGSINFDFKLKVMNIRYSNLCNYACRTCGPYHSSLWAQEQKHQFPVQVITETIPDYLKDLFGYLPYVEHLNFAGGESMLISEHWQVLDKLLELGKTDVHITYVTNLSKLTYQNKNLIEYAKKFKNFILIASIDASHERAEIYRHGTVWDTVESNIRKLRLNNINVQTNCTIGAMNIWHAPDLQRYLIESDLIDCNKFKMTCLVESQFLSAKILPLELKSKIKEKILDHIKWLNAHNIDYSKWIEVIDFMTSEDHTNLLPKFKVYNKQLDKIRNQRSYEVFPELQSILI